MIAPLWAMKTLLWIVVIMCWLTFIMLAVVFAQTVSGDFQILGLIIMFVCVGGCVPYFLRVLAWLTLLPKWLERCFYED